MAGGPGFQRAQGGPPSNTSGSQAGHNAPRQNPFGTGMAFDPARPAVRPESVITNTRVELPSSAYALNGPSVSQILRISIVDFLLFYFLFVARGFQVGNSLT
jgi:hypothetical protein